MYKIKIIHFVYISGVLWILAEKNNRASSFRLPVNISVQSGIVSYPSGRKAIKDDFQYHDSTCAIPDTFFQLFGKF